MLKSKLEKFLAKRVLILYAILTIISLVFISHRWSVLIGFTAGTIFSLFRLDFMASAFNKLIPQSSGEKFSVKQSVIRYITAQLTVFILLAASLKINQWVFAGMAAGFLLVALAVMINVFTEALGITHNNFE